MRRGELSIAERFECVVRLNPDDEALEHMWKALQVADVGRREFVPRVASLPPLIPEPLPSSSPQRSSGGPRSASASPVPVPRPFELHGLPRDDSASLPWAWESEPALSPEPASRESPPLEFLLAPISRAAILTAALSTRTHEGELDVPRVIETLAQGKPVKRLPRLPVPTLRHGVQLLVDVGEGMLPFAQDRAELVNAIQRLTPRVEMKMFLGCPSRGAGSGARPEKGWPRWMPPARGTVVMLLSDLGLGGPRLSLERARPAEWLAFCTQVRRTGCPLVAFVPYERHRWPRSLARAMVIVPWDRGTTAGAVRRSVGPGHKVEP